MVERQLYKTKLCLLYQKGHCHRQSCSFAHGDAELRRFSGSFNGRRDYRASDLRDTLRRRRSPLRKYSPGRDAGNRHTSHGYSPSRSIGEKSDGKRKKNQQLDAQSDFSGSLKISDGTIEPVKNKKLTSSDFKGILKEQLMQVQSDIDMLNDHKCQLEIYLEERAHEEDNLASQIQELEMQLFQEKEECKRITSKIKKFIRAHSHYSQIQNELERSQARLQKLGDQLGSDAARPGANEEDLSINFLSDIETPGDHVISPLNVLQKNACPSKKRSQINLEAAEESKPANLTKEEGTIRSGKLARWGTQHGQSNNKKEVFREDSGKYSHRPLPNEDKPNRGKNLSVNGPLAVKYTGDAENLDMEGPEDETMDVEIV